MQAVRALSASVTLLTVVKTMTSFTTTTSSDPRGLRASASRDAPCGSPQQRLQKLLAVPGSEPYRINDLLLLRPEADGHGDSDPEGTRCNRHVMFFHGDIQVSGGAVWRVAGSSHGAAEPGTRAALYGSNLQR